MNKLLRRYIELLKGRDKGTVAVTFLLSLPLLLFTLCVIVQYALIINARLVLNRAVSAAARSAMVCLPANPTIDLMGAEAYPTDADYASDLPDSNGVVRVDGVDCVNRSARMVLESISPKATSGNSEAATAITQQLQAAMQNAVADSYADHYTFAEAATSVEWTRLDDTGQPIAEDPWTPTQFAQARGQLVQFTVHYRFYLNVPGVSLWGPALTGQSGTETIAGVNGYFIPLTSTYTVQLTHGREAQAGASGSPIQPAPQ